MLETVEAEYLFDGVEDIVATRHLDGCEVSRSFWYGGFLCHDVSFFVSDREGNIFISNRYGVDDFIWGVDDDSSGDSLFSYS